MINLFDFAKKYILKLFILFAFWKIVKKHPNLKNYKKETIFSVYRSLFCLYFLLYSLENFLCNFSDLFTDPLVERDCYNDITDWFIVYLVFDLIKMISMGNTRIDLYFHHIWCLAGYVLGKYFNCAYSIFNLPLMAEAISIVSGIDLIAMENNEMEESYYYKVYRKNIIRYLRFPLWIISLLIVLKNTYKIPKLVWYNSIISSFIMLGLDHYWEKKCDKVIDKHKKSN